MNASDEKRSVCGQKNWCAACLREDGCSWCEGGNAVAAGSCQLQQDSCPSTSLVSDKAQCPSVGADVVLRNVSGLLGAMLALGIVLNILNRCSNKRRSKHLKRSIFTLPVYIYPSRERRAAALREARAQMRSTSGGVGDDTEDAASQTSDEDDAVVTCTICLATYENAEVIKVLPCGHDFHSECLDPWLEVKAMCPLCKAPAFSAWRDTSWRHHRQPQVHATNPSEEAAPGQSFRRLALLGSRLTDRLRGSPREDLRSTPNNSGGRPRQAVLPTQDSHSASESQEQDALWVAAEAGAASPMVGTEGVGHSDGREVVESLRPEQDAAGKDQEATKKRRSADAIVPVKVEHVTCRNPAAEGVVNVIDGENGENGINCGPAAKAVEQCPSPRLSSSLAGDKGRTGHLLCAQSGNDQVSLEDGHLISPRPESTSAPAVRTVCDSDSTREEGRVEVETSGPRVEMAASLNEVERLTANNGTAPIVSPRSVHLIKLEA